MADRKSYSSEFARSREQALSRWDNEGGAGAGGREHPASTGMADTPPLSNAELVQLQIRVIALENLMTALLAESSDQQLALVREIAAYISPHPGHTLHRLTVHAASRMVRLAEAAGRLRKLRPDEEVLGGPSGPESLL